MLETHQPQIYQWILAWIIVQNYKCQIVVKIGKPRSPQNCSELSNRHQIFPSYWGYLISNYSDLTFMHFLFQSSLQPIENSELLQTWKKKGGGEEQPPKTKTTHKKTPNPSKKTLKKTPKNPTQPNHPELEEASTIQSATVCSFLNLFFLGFCGCDLYLKIFAVSLMFTVYLPQSANCFCSSLINFSLLMVWCKGQLFCLSH